MLVFRDRQRVRSSRANGGAARLARLLALAASAVLLVAASGCGAAGSDSGSAEGSGKRLTVGIGVDAAYTPWLVGVEKGFFAKNGIDLQLKTFQDGAAAFDSVLTGDVDLAGPGQFPPIPASAKGGKLALAGVYATSGYQFGAVAGDSIRRPADLYDATIGVPKGTSAEYWLDRYAEFHDLDQRRLRLKNVAAPDLVAAMSRGDIDAFFAFDPHVSRAAEAIDGVRVLARGADNDIFAVKAFVAMTQRLARDTKAADAVVRSMVEATRWAQENQDEAAEITARKFNIQPDAALEGVKNFRYDVYLDEATEKEMRSIAGWMKENGLIQSTPDFDVLFDVKPLKSVAPAKLTIDQ